MAKEKKWRVRELVDYIDIRVARRFLVSRGRTRRLDAAAKVLEAKGVPKLGETLVVTRKTATFQVDGCWLVVCEYGPPDAKPP